MKILSNPVAVSDADVLIKLCKAGHLDILKKFFVDVIIPKRVFEEVESKLEKRFFKVFKKALTCGWIRMVDIYDNNVFNHEEITAMAIIMNSFRYALDDGEREAFALANELNIPFLLSDDRNAKRIIEFNSTIVSLSYVEVLSLAIITNIIRLNDTKNIHQKINSIVNRPINVPFEVLHKRAKKRFDSIGLFK
ncbi:hypothetical protein [Desulfofundulus thermosubterraneus]|uniref:PIN domain-containing protein n=1 Tax=Desulfofundulus thermosubterraneus DSM 16057 TaxID=1121432 RepID=A0A1M6F0I1_9FIRM|nr:hypothetical protein [Desulfofundulus thermosubterraneus]SHI91175.1 hypothetical protein SAMN02745219_01350 [Desulfofundulus thermosubterraneus DSM 16057]